MDFGLPLLLPLTNFYIKYTWSLAMACCLDGSLSLACLFDNACDARPSRTFPRASPPSLRPVSHSRWLDKVYHIALVVFPFRRYEVALLRFSLLFASSFLSLPLTLCWLYLLPSASAIYKFLCFPAFLSLCDHISRHAKATRGGRRAT